MRREVKNRLRAIALSDVVGKWQMGRADFTVELVDFKMRTEATDAEMTHFALAIEEEIIRRTRAELETVKSLKVPSLRALCQKMCELEERRWEKKPLITRLEEFEEILVDWRIHYGRLIEAAGIALYSDMLEKGVEHKVILRRIKKGMDVYCVWKGESFIWDSFNRLLEDWFNIRTGKVKGELQVFVEDKQNIHTGPVSSQTDATLTQLFAVPVPATQKTVSEIYEQWWYLRCGHNEVTDHIDGVSKFMEIFRVLADVKLWSAKSLVVEKGDYLYRRVLQHLWAKIKGYPKEIRDELTRRLYEECRDAEGMCAQGHIARLANVLVGFDDAFKGEVSLQDLMAEISRREATVEEKRAAATAILEERRVAAEEREAWLDAFDA